MCVRGIGYVCAFGCVVACAYWLRVYRLVCVCALLRVAVGVTVLLLVYVAVVVVVVGMVVVCVSACAVLLGCVIR